MMIFKTISKYLFTVSSVSLLVSLILIYSPADAQSGPCSQHPDNLIQNGSMLDSESGGTASGWSKFVINGAPHFSLQRNENANGDIASAAQHIDSDKHPFDAGIYQVVSNVQPGVYYRARVGQALAAVDYGGGINTRNGDIGRRIGVDPFGGTDPNSPNVIWGTEFRDLGPALNIPDLTILVAARSNRLTVFVRAIDHNSSGLSKIWFDVVCLKPESSLPTATPLAPTATPVTPTNTPRPAVVRAPNTPTKIAQAQTNTPFPAEIGAPHTPTPTTTNTIEPTATARFARPDVTPASGASIDLGIGIAAVVGLLLVGGAIVFFGIGIFWWTRMR